MLAIVAKNYVKVIITENSRVLLFQDSLSVKDVLLEKD